MSTDAPSPPPTLKTDIDYLKSLAEAGDRAPLNIGRSLFWAGLIYGLASLIQYGMIINVIPMPNPWFMSLNWGAAILVHLGITFFVRRKRCTGTTAASNRAAQAAWSGVGMGIFSFFTAVIVLSSIYKRTEEVSFLLAPAVLAIYGIGWWVSARMAETKWVLWVAFGCFLSAPALCLLSGRAEQLLAYSACLVLLATLPGYKLIKDAKQ